MGASLSQQHKLNAAAAHYEAAVALMPYHERGKGFVAAHLAGALDNLADVLERKGEFMRGRALLERAVEETPKEFVQPFVRLAVWELQHGSREEGITLILKACAINDQDSDINVFIREIRARSSPDDADVEKVLQSCLKKPVTSLPE
jgi:tetratricopeptide (TPR) repeat protein